MSEEFESEPQTEDSGINPIGKYLIYAVVVIVVGCPAATIIFACAPL